MALVQTERLNAWAPKALSIVRIVAGLLFLEHGLMKLVGWPPSDQAQPPVGSIFWVGGVLELVGGSLLALGLFTRPVAFVISGEMAVAYFMSHAPKSLFPAVNMGDAAILYCFLFLYFVFAGPGPWSLDAALRKRL